MMAVSALVRENLVRSTTIYRVRDSKVQGEFHLLRTFKRGHVQYLH